MKSEKYLQDIYKNQIKKIYHIKSEDQKANYLKAYVKCNKSNTCEADCKCKPRMGLSLSTYMFNVRAFATTDNKRNMPLEASHLRGCSMCDRCRAW